MINIREDYKLKDFAEFIAKLNVNPCHHVGYCGTNVNELYETLCEVFSSGPNKKSIVSIYDDNELIGLIGLDIDNQSGELWGPFIIHEDWNQIANMLWNQLLKQMQTHVNDVFTFYNHQNNNCRNWMKLLNANPKGEHFILTLNRNNFLNSYEQTYQIQHLTKNLYQSFSKLHDDMFPNTYYDGQDIIQKLNHENEVLVLTNEQQVIGYIYVEANRAFKEGDIHFLAVSPQHRGQGSGKHLLKAGLQLVFSFPEIQTITLCVDSTNDQIIKLYKSVGFNQINHLHAFQISI